MKRKSAVRFGAVLLAASLLATSVPYDGTGIVQVMAAEDQSGGIMVSQECAFDSTSSWDTQLSKDLGITTTSVPTDGTTLAMDVLLEAENGLDFSGVLMVQGVLRVGAYWSWVQSNVIKSLAAGDFTETVTIDGVTYAKASVEIPFSDTVGANLDSGWSNEAPFEEAVNDVISAVTVQLAGYMCDYSGTAAIANARLVEPEESTAESAAVKSYTFDSGTDGWAYASGWEWQYDGEKPEVSWDESVKMLKVTADYSQNASDGWSQFTIQNWGEFNGAGVNAMSFDFYYDDSIADSGDFYAKLVMQEKDTYATAADGSVRIDKSAAVDAAEDGLAGYKKVSVTISFDTVTTDVTNVALCLVGSNTAYKGALFLDNITLSKEAEKESTSVSSTVAAETGNPLSVSGTTLTLGDKSTQTLTDSVALVDENATDATKAVYAYLKAVGESDSMIYGHQDDTWQKAGSSSLSSSDTLDVTGSIAGVVGMDVLSLVGNEYSASRYNSEIAAADESVPAIDTEGQCAASANVEAAAKLANLAIADGAILTLSAHMPNFSTVKETTSYDETTDPTYAAYNFSGYTPNDLTGDVMNEILPGGAYSDMYNAYLDMIADFASQVDGVILFRPFHENTGNWFWWGASSCTAEQYKNVYRYTVEYLRDTKNVHNMLYVYGPSSDAESTDDYALRYPGDAYVDMVGFDMYDADPVSDEDGYAFMEKFENELAIVNAFATEHGKLLAVTETGISSSIADEGDGQTALHETGNQQKDWYNKELEVISKSDACYMLLWANFSKNDGYYTPYVDKVNEDGTLFGHEMLDNFISFYNDERTIFAADQKDVLSAIDGSGICADAAAKELLGYITAPVDGKRILGAATLTAQLSKETDETITFVLTGKAGSITLSGVTDGKSVSAVLDEEALLSLGASIDGTIALCAGDTVLQTISVIFNIAEPVEDPYVVDSFEDYYGIDSLLAEKWNTNHAADSSIEVSLAAEGAAEGDYAMKFSYRETEDGWAGVTIDKTADWSECNALRFYVTPDGKNQKTVVQITADDTVYEAYLNTYTDYAADTDGTTLLVTIPFADFCERDTEGNPTGGLVRDAADVTSIGLWVNAIAGSDAICEDGTVCGVLVYDRIEAVAIDEAQASFVVQTTEVPKTEEPKTEEPKTEESKTEETASETTKTQETTETIYVSLSDTRSAKLTVKKNASGSVLSAVAKFTITGTATAKGTKAVLTKADVDKIKRAVGGANVTIKLTVKKEDGSTAFTVQTDSANIKAGKKLYLYEIKNGSYVAVNAKTYTVSEKSEKLTASQKKTYVLLNAAEAKAASKAILKTVKAKKSSVTLKAGEKKAFALSSKCSTANIKSITYSSTKSSVAAVSKKGTITAKKAGTATIKAKVTLKNGKTKTVSMKVTVK